METHGVQLPSEMERQNVELMELYMAMEKEPHMSQVDSSQYQTVQRDCLKPKSSESWLQIL